MIELYINNRLCDVGEDIGVRLDRQLLKPGELNTKDAQCSYKITLPPTQNNHDIFGYANVEETNNKFNRMYTAELIINSVRVFKGMFRMSQVSAESYIGNLCIPAPKSITDIFGDKKLNENAPFPLQFQDFAESMSKYNIDAQTSPQAAIFPYTLYGVLPKVPKDKSGEYSDRTLWDGTVTIGVQDFPASINPLIMLKHIFTSRGYNIGGSAFNDPRLTNLYMSYKNDPSYPQPWNYGWLGRISVKGMWSNVYDYKVGRESLAFEKGVYYQNYDNGDNLYSCNLLDCTNSKIDVMQDFGGNVINKTVNDGDRNWTRAQIRIPVSGYYKMSLRANSFLELKDKNELRTQANGVRYIAAYGSRGGFEYMRSSIKLIRDRGNADFGVSSSRLDGTYYKDNQPQVSTLGPDYTPKYIPTYYGNGKGSIVFVDMLQNENHVAGFQHGKKSGEDVSPLPNANDTDYSKITVAKPGGSYDRTYAGKLNRIAVNNPSGYYVYDFPDGDTENRPAWMYDPTTAKYKYIISNIPSSYPENYASRVDDDSYGYNYHGAGSVSAIVWFDAGELLTLVDTSDRGEMIVASGAGSATYRGWVAKSTTFELDLIPFRSDIDWLKINEAGVQTETINWDDPTNFDSETIDLVKFLPADMKTDDFIDNFCKAFNLQLTQVDAKNFQLNVKQTKAALSSQFLNLDNLASVRDRVNTPLGLPSLYKLGFTIDTEEEGYVETGDDGGGEYSTGTMEEKIVEQKSNFSYNWFKNITKDGVTLPLAIISKQDVWSMPYPDAMAKRYTNQPLRFWYPGGLLNGTFTFGAKSLSIAQVSNTLPGLSILNYKNQKLTILDNYFTLLIDGSSHFTEVEGYLTPAQYDALNGAIMAMFNGDMYYVAELHGYDPSGRNKTKIKLIRKI